MKRKLALIGLALTGLLTLPEASAQITNVVFSDDFSKNGIDTNKYAIDAPFFEGGKGTIAPTIANGVVEFTGTVTEQWWAGATLRVVQPFSVNDETNVVVSVDRVSETGGTTAARSALWIMDGTRTKYVLFADNTTEGGWQANRKIGIAGDVPTGGGSNITPFDGDPWDDLGLHRMKAVANGKTVKLYLDGVFGTEVLFPFDQVVVEIGSYARANNDFAGTTFDNLKVETVGATAFSTTALTLVSGQTSDITVRIPSGANQTQAIQVRVISADPTIAIPVGASAGTLTLTFAAGASNEQKLSVKSVGASGGVQFTLANDIGMAVANSLGVVVIEGAGVRLTDDFASSTIDSSKWTNSSVAFETGAGAFVAEQKSGQLVLSGLLDASYWGGVSLNSVKPFTATPDLPLSFEVDRVSIDPTDGYGAAPSTAARTGVFITTADRSQYVFFGQNVGETGWEVNVNPGNPTGSGTALSAFSGITNNSSHRMKLVADGTSVQVYLDGQLGGSYAFAVNTGIHFHLGAYARDVNDAVKGVFDNVKIENINPPVAVAPDSVITAIGVNTQAVTVTIPRFLNATKAVAVTVTSQDPKVAVPQGAVNGALTLQFAAGAAPVQSFNVVAASVGTTSLTFTNDQAVATANGVAITVTTPLGSVFSDNFASGVDTNKNWLFDGTPLDAVTPGTYTADSALSVADGVLKMSVIAETANWPGMALKTVKKYSATQTSPIEFEVDRVKLDYNLVTGTGAQERGGVWVFDSTGANYVFFNEYVTHSGTIQGWQFNRSIGQAGDTAVPAAGTLISAFGPASFNDQGNHHMKLVVNGIDAKLYLDGVYGASVAFPFATGLSFGIGAYVAAATDNVFGFWDNANVLGTVPSLGSLAAAKQANGDLVISWTGAGTLQSSSALPGNWSNVSPAPSGTSHTIPPASLTGPKFFRLSQ